jgi:hypothetical protein
VYELVPPTLAELFPFLFYTNFEIVFIQNGWPIQFKYVEKGFIVEDVDGCTK